MNKNNKIYLKYILTSIVIVGFFATIQFVFIFHEFKATLVVIPTIVAIIFGILLAKISIYKKHITDQQELFKAIADEAREFSYFRDLDGKYLYISPVVEEITGYSIQMFYENNSFMDTLIHKDDLHIWNHHVHHINSHSQHDFLELRLINKNGKIVWFEHICSQVLDDDGNVKGIRSTNIDITQRKNNEFKLKHLASFDPLTNVKNKRTLENDIKTLINEESQFALILLDLDNFKFINDNYGHSFGDEFLVQISQRINRFCDNEKSTLYRFGGDEFIIVYSGYKNQQDIINFSTNILNSFIQPFDVYKSSVNATFSVGISIRENKSTYETILKNADIAMYQVKESGKNNFAIYDEKIAAIYKQKNELSRLLQLAILNKHNQFHVHFQAQYNNDLEVIGFEALARWNSDIGTINPADFFSIAEKDGVIVDLEKIIKLQTLKDFREIIKKYPAVSLSINFSSSLLSSDEFMNFFIESVTNYGFNPKQIDIEIIESLFINQNSLALQNITKLKTLGYDISIDDFGTGYSSLTYFKYMPISSVKIDQSFIQNMLESKTDMDIVNIIIDFTKKLGFDVIAEGVETKEQLEVLKKFDCNIFQGFYLSKPLSKDTIINQGV